MRVVSPPVVLTVSGGVGAWVSRVTVIEAVAPVVPAPVRTKHT